MTMSLPAGAVAMPPEPPADADDAAVRAWLVARDAAAAVNAPGVAPCPDWCTDCDTWGITTADPYLYVRTHGHPVGSGTVAVCQNEYRRVAEIESAWEPAHVSVMLEAGDELALVQAEQLFCELRSAVVLLREMSTR